MTSKRTDSKIVHVAHRLGWKNVVFIFSPMGMLRDFSRGLLS
jgi:hypothetical protein